MNILIVSQYFHPESFGINQLARDLRDSGHRVTVFTGMPNYPSGRFPPGFGGLLCRRDDFDGIPVQRVPLIARRDASALRLALNYLSFAINASVMAPFLLRAPVDVVLVYEPSPITVGLPAVVVKWLKRAPILFWVQDLWPESLVATGAVRGKFISALMGRLVRFIYRRCDIILVASRAFAESIRRMVADADIRYFPNSVENFYRPIDLAQDAPERRLVPDGFKVMFAGNIGAAQDFPTLLSAAERLRDHPDIHWVIIGDGRMRRWVEEQVAARKLTATVHLLERREAEAMPRFFAAADALLVTLRKHDIFARTVPSKMQPYLACGRPIIASLEGEGAAILCEAGAGVACCPESPAALAEAVLRIYQMPEPERAEMGRAGRRYFEREFERTILLDRLNVWLDQLQSKKICAS